MPGLILAGDGCVILLGAKGVPIEISDDNDLLPALAFRHQGGSYPKLGL